MYMYIYIYIIYKHIIYIMLFDSFKKTLFTVLIMTKFKFMMPIVKKVDKSQHVFTPHIVGLYFVFL